MKPIEFKMAWRNVWRNPRRSILTILAIAFANLLLIFMLSWQFGSYETMINSTVKIQTGHLQVQAKAYQDKNEIRLTVPDPEAVTKILQKMPGVNIFTLRSRAFSLIASKDRTYGAMIIGIDPARENRLSSLSNLLRKGSYLAAADGNQAMIGKLLAENLKVDIGDELVVLGQGRDASVAATVVSVKGIFSSGQDDFDRGLVHVPLRYFQEVYAMGEAVHEVVVICDSLKNVEEVKQGLLDEIERMNTQDRLVVLDWTELMPGLIEAIKMDLAAGFIFYIILIVVVAFSILNTFLMAIFERTKEFGILMAVGITPGRLTRLLLLESLSMTLLGVIVGAVAGCLVAYYYQTQGIIIPEASELLRQYGLPERMYPKLSFLSLSLGSGIVLLITSLAALYPSLKVRRLKPVEAMAAV